MKSIFYGVHERQLSSDEVEFGISFIINYGVEEYEIYLINWYNVTILIPITNLIL